MFLLYIMITNKHNLRGENKMFVHCHIYRVQLLSQLPVAGPEDMGGHLGLPLPGEDALLVARHPPRLLLGHEVSKIPNMLAWVEFLHIYS